MHIGILASIAELAPPIKSDFCKWPCSSMVWATTLAQRCIPSPFVSRTLMQLRLSQNAADQTQVQQRPVVNVVEKVPVDARKKTCLKCDLEMPSVECLRP